jgi:hypothetical protein
MNLKRSLSISSAVINISCSLVKDVLLRIRFLVQPFIQSFSISINDGVRISCASSSDICQYFHSLYYIKLFDLNLWSNIKKTVRILITQLS